MRKTLVYKQNEMILSVNTYKDKSLALSLTDAETGEPWSTLTVCIDYPMPYGVAAIKNYSENEGMLQWLIENNLIRTLLGSERTGYVSVPLVCVNMQVLVGFDENGIMEYRRRHKINDKLHDGFEIGSIRISPSLQFEASPAEIGTALAEYVECR
jgi:hypothetical protein